jgi:signal peptidase I
MQEEENTLENNLENKTQNKWASVWEIVKFAFIALIIVIPIRTFIAQPFVVSGASMFPTFNNGDYLIVDELSYRLNDPKRYDVIIFKYPKDTSKFFVKRVIGLPNETVEIHKNEIIIKNENNPEGFILDQSFIENNTQENISFELSEDEYFVMGDNRIASSDSRYWGAVKRELVVGRALIRLLPINKASILPGKFEGQ